ncbi:hypothetical protein G4Z16_17735 [Streptomyces bathyalis]|uniref:LysR substrate-binding domain-containing protein n=1 Tax=Streptomyces bathyalis TaxID=2710756 RepID=A0A7T1T7S4_9ACTN|nr:hypothetical protein [Streptomyces bathyalis]QPP07939.1 hypothetical protein G4Z16_17735 [Streptomyces bathyalis]
MGAAVVADSWGPLAEAVGLRVRRLAVDDALDVGLVRQRHRLSPAAAAFLAAITGEQGTGEQGTGEGRTRRNR